MSVVTQDEYSKLCDKFELFKMMGFDGFETKLWLTFKALTDGTVSVVSVAKNPCQSLMENNIHFSSIEAYLDKLSNNGLLKKTSKGEYFLKPEHSYELHNICFKITSKLDKSQNALHDLIKECGYVYDSRNRDLVNRYTSGDINDKENTFTNLMTQLAFAGARLLIKIVVHIEEKIDN